MDNVLKNRTLVIITVAATFAALVVMAGWMFDIPALQGVVPGFEALRFNTALCFFLFGSASLIVQCYYQKYRVPLVFLLSLSGMLIAVFTLAEYVFHYSSGLDQLFVVDASPPSYRVPYPGRMAFNSALNFVFFGLGFLLLIPRKGLTNVISQLFFHLVIILSSIALIGYLYGVSFFRIFLYKTSMPVHTAILFLILSIPASLINRSLGLTRLLTGEREGSRVGKRLTFLMILMALIFGSLVIHSNRFDPLISLNLRIAVLAVGFLLISLVLIWSTAYWLNKIDKQRSEAEEEVRQMNLQLEKRVEERTAEVRKSEQKYYSLIEQASDAIYITDFAGKFTDVNASMCKMTGYSREELLQLNVRDIIDPEELKADPLWEPIRGVSESEIRERHFVRRNGEVFTVEVNKKIFTDDRVMVIARDISYRKIIENKLKDTELKFRTLAEKSMVGVYMIVQGGKFSYVNPRFAEIFGYSPEELINSLAGEAIIDESYRHIARENVRKRIDGEAESIRYEAMGKKKDGSNNWVEFYGNRAIIGNQPTIVGTAIDITERKKAEEALRSSEKKYKLLFETSPVPLWMVNKNNLSIIAVNDAAASLYGYTCDELLQSTIKQLRLPEDQDKMEVFEMELSVSTDLGVIRQCKKDGTIMSVQIISHDIVFEGRKVRLTLTNDVTEKLKAEESLKKSEANLQSILNTTNTAYALFDTEMRVLEFNPSALQFVKEQYGFTLTKDVRLDEHFPKQRMAQLEHINSEILKGNSISYEVDYPQADGSTRWYYVRMFPILNDQKEILGMLAALYDITEPKNAEQDLKNAYQSIQNHVESIRDMAWKQSHLIRSPLANLKGLFALLNEDPTEIQIFSLIQAELERMDAILIEMAREAATHGIGE